MDLINAKMEGEKEMTSSIIGKWRAINAPHKIEFFSDGTCETYSPADGETIQGSYSTSGDTIRVTIDGGSRITFEVVGGSSIQMLPPAGRALPPLPFERA